MAGVVCQTNFAKCTLGSNLSTTHVLIKYNIFSLFDGFVFMFLHLQYVSFLNTRETQMKTLNIFYLVIYWKQKVHNDFIYLFSLHCIPYKCYSASEVRAYL